jgi:hypothetical protein
MGATLWVQNHVSVCGISSQGLAWKKKKKLKPSFRQENSYSWLLFFGCRWWYSHDIHVDFHEPWTTFSSQHYVATLKAVKQKWKEFGSIRRKFCYSATVLGPRHCEPPWKQLRHWISPSYHTCHRVQTWHDVGSTFSHKWRETFMGICVTQMKRWKGLWGSEWRNKVWSSFVTAVRNLSVVGVSVWTVVVTVWRGD